MNSKIKKRTDLVVDAAIALCSQYVFLCPLISSKKFRASKSQSRHQFAGLRYQQSISRRYLVLSVFQLWDEERENKRGDVKFPIDSIPGIQKLLTKSLPEPEEFTKDCRTVCRKNLRESDSKTWKSIRFIRDKCVAHSELEICKHSGAIERINPREAELTDDLLFEFLFKTLEIADGLNHVVRNGSGFCWDAHVMTQKKIAEAYYGVDDFKIQIPELNISV